MFCVCLREHSLSFLSTLRGEEIRLRFRRRNFFHFFGLCQRVVIGMGIVPWYTSLLFKGPESCFSQPDRVSELPGGLEVDLTNYSEGEVFRSRTSALSINKRDYVSVVVSFNSFYFLVHLYRISFFFFL